MPPETTAQIDDMTSEQRIALVNTINKRVNADDPTDPVTDGEINLGLYACRLERTRASSSSKKTKEPAVQYTVDDL